MSREASKNLLVVIIDTNPSWWGNQQDFSLIQCLEAVMSFCNAHLLMKPDNRLAIVVAHTSCSKQLYPKSELQSTFEPTQIINDGRYEVFSEMNMILVEEISSLILNDSDINLYSDTLIAGALSTSLCYINRITKEEKEKGSKIDSRILIIQGGRDNPTQYMNFMNAVFSAQKMSIIIDSCILETPSILLQQASDITDGIYMVIRQITGLLQYLLWVFLPCAGKGRDLLNLPPKQRVDYRAACFCHRHLVEIGFVCSVCLSIFCMFSPICTTCQTKFLLPSRTRKRRIV